MYASNMSIEERVKYATESMTKEQLLDMIYEMQDTVIKAQKDIEILEKREERMQEQIYFAQDLVEMIDNAVKQHSRFKEFKEAYRLIREETYFEI